MKTQTITLKLKLKLKHYSSPCHGWVKVENALMVTLGIISKISSYSFRSDTHWMIEEDSDARILINALKAAGIEYEIEGIEKPNRAFLNNYKRVGD